MANIHCGIDRDVSYSVDINNLNIFCKKLEEAGHQVTNVGRGPSAVQSHLNKASNKCDIAVLIANGQCPGTFADFHLGTRPGGYYHADKYCFPLNTEHWQNYAHYNPSTYKLPLSAWDDSFSGGLDKSKIVGRTWKEVCNDKTNFPRSVGFVEGKGGAELAKRFLALLGGSTGDSTSSNSTGAGSGGSILDYIKQVCSDLDPYGVELDLIGDTVHIHKSQINNAKPLGESRVLNSSVTYQDYDSNTPNSNGKAKDQYLIDRFGELPLEATVSGDEAQVLQIAQRGHGHSIDLKCLLSQDYQAGNWVKLTLPSLNIENRKYYISKASYDEELATTITLEPGPPSLYVDTQDLAEEEVVEETEEVEE